MVARFWIDLEHWLVSQLFCSMKQSFTFWPNERPAVDAAGASLLHLEHHLRGATEAGR